MPCRSDYMEPSNQEAQNQNLCKLLTYTLNKYKLSHPQKSTIQAGMVSSYGSRISLEKLTQDLCAILTNLGDDTVYGDRTATGLKVALWWTEHKEADRQRKEIEESERKRKQLVEQALSKLTPQERQALRAHYSGI